MTQIAPISTVNVPNTNLGKHANPKIVEAEVQKFVSQLLTKNPNITEEQVMVEVRNFLQDAKVGKKVIATTQANIPQIIKDCTPKPVVTTPTPVIKTMLEIPSETLQAYPPMTKVEIPKPQEAVITKTETKLRKKLEKQGLSEVLPSDISEQAKWEAKMAEKPVTEPQKSNNQNKKAANSEYQSSKKLKIAKKKAEEKSRIEHKNRRFKNSRTGRNLSYCTKNGIISSEAKGAKEAMEIVKNSQGLFTKEAMAVYPDNKPINEHARESFKVFEDAGLIPKEVKPHIPKQNSYRPISRNYSYSSGTAKAASIHTTPLSTSPAINTVKKEVVTEIKEVIKEVPKTNKWLVAGAVVTGGVLGWLGTKFFSNNNKQVS